MTDVPAAAEAPATPWPPVIETWVMPYLGETFLWPVLVAVIGHVVALQALIVLNAWRQPLPLAGFACGLLVVLTLRLMWTEIAFYRRPRGVSLFLGICWGLSIAGAVIADHYDAL